jgi:hypothetical protein
MSIFEMRNEEPETIEFNGIKLVCQVCGQNKFWITESTNRERKKYPSDMSSLR